MAGSHTRIASKASESVMEPTILCPGCGRLFPPHRPNQRHCRPSCRQRHYERRHGLALPLPWDEPPASDDTFRNRLAAYFRARPWQWIDGLELGTVGGGYAWRTRKSECCRHLGMRIINRQRKVGRRTVSEYRYEPEA